MIPIAKPCLSEEEIKAAAEVIKSGVLTQGGKTEQFEERFGEYLGVKEAIAVSSGSAALYLSLIAHNIGVGDEVVTSPFTFVATANAILLSGAKPVFADITEVDFNIDPQKIEEKITERTKAVIPVHLFGQPADMRQIIKVAEDNNLLVIEDACQSHGAEYEGKKVGSFGTGAFSFYPTKNMTTGEGGMVTTNDEKISLKIKQLRNHGSFDKDRCDLLGFNFRMTEIGAALGIKQLEKLDDFNSTRANNALYLSDKLKEIKGVSIPTVCKGRKHVFHQYTVRVDKDFGKSRDKVARYLKEKGIITGVYYRFPLHKQPLYERLGYGHEGLPVSERVSNEVLSLPAHPGVSRQNLDYIAATIKEI